MSHEKSIFTQAVHAGERGPRPDFTPVSTPIYHSVGYVYDDMNDLDAIFANQRAGFVYPRYGSPTVGAFEQAMAILEGAENAVAFGSGMAALHAALLGALWHGAVLAAAPGHDTGGGVTDQSTPSPTVVAAADLYGATYALLERLLTTLGIRVRFVDITDLSQVQQALAAGAAAGGRPRPLALLCEIISNPLMKVADVPALAELAHGAGAALIVDSTFASPYLFSPLAHGADYCVHSATKYLAGHGDVMAGVVACSAQRGRDLRERQKLLGANLGPQEAWLAHRGLKTLPLRMRQHCANAQAVAEWLAAHPAVARVNYPGLPEHPQHGLAARLFKGRGYGGMLSFDLRGAGPATAGPVRASQADVFRFLEALELVLPATTLGDVYSLTLYPAHSSHRLVAPEARAALGIGDGLVRLSAGIEDAVDIVADLAQALERLGADA